MATGESPFEYVDVYKYTEEIRRNVWKLRMERECFSYKCWCEGDKDSYLTTSLFIVQF